MSALDKSTWSKGFDGLGRLLQTSSRLKAANVKIIVPDKDDPQLWLAPTVEKMPAIRLSLAASTTKVQSEREHAAPLTIRIETFSKGYNILDSLDLWYAVIAAIFPQDQAGRSAADRLLYEAGIPRLSLIRQATDPTPPDSDSPFLYSYGELLMQVHLQTPEK